MPHCHKSRGVRSAMEEDYLYQSNFTERVVQDRMRVLTMSRFIAHLFLFISCSALPWTQEYVKYGESNYIFMSPNTFWNSGLEREPNCDELKAMWRFSVIKSRRTEITNEIPTYRDPFASNSYTSSVVSKPYHSGSLYSSGYKSLKKQVYGKLIHSVPSEMYLEKLRMKDRSFLDMTKHTLADKAITPRRKNAEAFRLPNGQVSFRKLPTLSDSFSHLKAVIRSQRVKGMKGNPSSKGSYSNGMKEVSKGPIIQDNTFHNQYFMNDSLNQKRSPLSKSLHFITDLSSLIYSPPEHDNLAYVRAYDGLDDLYSNRLQSLPLNVKLNIFPIRMPLLED